MGDGYRVAPFIISNCQSPSGSDAIVDIDRSGYYGIQYFMTSWQSEILSAPDLAVSRLSELCAPKFVPAAKDRFLVEPQDYSKLYDGAEGPLHLLAQKWRMSFNHLHPSATSFAISSTFVAHDNRWCEPAGIRTPYSCFI